MWQDVRYRVRSNPTKVSLWTRWGVGANETIGHLRKSEYFSVLLSVLENIGFVQSGVVEPEEFLYTSYCLIYNGSVTSIRHPGDEVIT